MKTYLISLPYDRYGKHLETISDHSRLIQRCGVDFNRFTWAHGGPGNIHTWSVECDDEELSLLILSGGKKLRIDYV